MRVRAMLKYQGGSFTMRTFSTWEACEAWALAHNCEVVETRWVK